MAGRGLRQQEIIDAYFCSYQKSGRTWMRFALANVLNDHYQLGIDLNLNNMFQIVPKAENRSSKSDWKGIEYFRFREQGVPLIASSHRPWEQRFASRPTIWMVRNPADVLLSYYYHSTRATKRFQGSMSEFAVDQQFGIPALIDYLCSWLPHIDNENILTISYEQMRREPLAGFQQITTHLKLDVNEQQCRRAVEASTLDKMKALEDRYGVGNPYGHDHSDPQARRVRSGRVGAAKQELPSEVLQQLSAAITTAGIGDKLDQLGISGNNRGR